MFRPKRILLTGASGFVGRAVMEHIISTEHYALTVSTRTDAVLFPDVVKVVRNEGLALAANWGEALNGVDTVVHLAARAHVLRDRSSDPLAEFRRVNVEGTLELARQALAAGVKRFIFISSIGVNGSITTNQAFTELSATLPDAFYAVSKAEAERLLWGLCNESGMELVVIRPPLVYAGHAPGNFARLLKLVASGIPLPFASVVNQRSMIALENLVDFIMLCVSHSSAGNQLFLVSDGEDLSTPSVLQHMAVGMNKRSRLFTLPVSFMRMGAKAVRRERMFGQLCGSLVIDSSKARSVLNWSPPVSVSYGLQRAAHSYLTHRTRL